jgi:CRP-like cAMP-binding protein
MPRFQQNRLLASLAESDLQQITPEMEDVELRSGIVVFEPGAPITHVYFPLTGIVALLVMGEDGSGTEIAAIGNEGLVGIGGLLAGDVSFTRQVVQLPGTAVRVARAPFLAAVNQSWRLRSRLAAQADAFTAQLMQSAACNASHSAEQRLARWLLTTSDRSGQDALPFTHHAIAEMLAVQRPTITLVVRMMQSAGLIESRRGLTTIVDRAALSSFCCQCYRIIRRAYDQVLTAGEE